MCVYQYNLRPESSPKPNILQQQINMIITNPQPNPNPNLYPNPYRSNPNPPPHPPALKHTNSEILSNNENMSQKQKQSVKSATNRKPISQSTSNSGRKLSKQLARQLVANSKRNRDSGHIGVQDVFRSALRLFVCKMCYNNVEIKDTASLGDCRHTFCLECLTQYTIYKIKIHENVVCPEQGCKVQLNEHSQFYQLLPDQIKQKHKQNELWKQTFDNPNLKLCQKQQCKGGLIDMLKIPPTCQKCGMHYCKECMMVAHEGPCDQNFEYQFQEWKRCPNCKMFIQKSQGCNHMTCRCGREFCFVCGASWDPGHYQCVEGLENRLFFGEVQTMTKPRALLGLIGLCLLVPVFIIGLAIMLAAGIAFTSAIGVIVAPCALAKQISSCCCCCLFWLILLPFAMAVGAIASPIFFTVTAFKPFAQRIMRQHFNSIQFLIQQVKGVNRRPRPREPIQAIQQP